VTLCDQPNHGCLKDFAWAGSIVEFGDDGEHVFWAVQRQVGPPEVLAQQPVGVLIAASFPGQ
jgi:hypothetical protein